MRAWWGALGGLLLVLGCNRPNAAYELSDGSSADRQPQPSVDGGVDVTADRPSDPAPSADVAPPDLLPADVVVADASPPDPPPPDAPPPDAPSPDAPPDVLPADARPPDVMDAPLPVGTGLRGHYYDGDGLEGGDTGALVLDRIDATVNFDWGAGRIMDHIDDDWFSIRWTGKVMPLHSETFTFRVVSDEGVRLWVNGQSVIQGWTASGRAVTRSGTITLQAYQQYDIRLEYFESTGNASIQLSWMSPSQPLQVIPRERLFPP